MIPSCRFGQTSIPVLPMAKLQRNRFLYDRRPTNPSVTNTPLVDSLAVVLNPITSWQSRKSVPSAWFAHVSFARLFSFSWLRVGMAIFPLVLLMVILPVFLHMIRCMVQSRFYLNLFCPALVARVETPYSCLHLTYRCAQPRKHSWILRNITCYCSHVSLGRHLERGNYR